MEIATLDPKKYYRLPWTLTDNVLGWLEPTKRCNLYCEGCYSRNDPKSDKTLEQVRSDLEVFTKNRKMDSISIAGGDPLVYPHIVEVVRMIRHDFGLKPIINTNGLALNPDYLRRLKDAGVAGFTFHIDSGQVRPEWKGKSEIELNALRLRYARMVADAGDLSCAFNSTIYRHTMHQVPDLMEWAAEHIDIVSSMVFILFRTSRAEEYDYYACGKKIDVEDLVYFGQTKNPEPITAQEMVGLIRTRFPDFDPCAYLGGTADPNSFKWLLTARIGSPGKVNGYLGPRYMEFVQAGHHMLFDRYVAYTKPQVLASGKGLSLALAPFDGGARSALWNIAKETLKSPTYALKNQYLQSILIIQPIDFLADGQANMCDGCPDMTVHDGQLVWSCRLDERLEHGCWLNAAPKCGGPSQGATAPGSNGDRRHLPTV